MNGLSSWSARAVIAAWAIVAAATIFMALSVTHAGYINAPAWDDWLNADPADYLPRLFEKYNGHPIVIGRIVLALDYYLFDAQGWALRYATLIVLALSAFTAAELGRLAGLQSLMARIVLGAFALIMLLNPQGAQNYTWGFQFCFVSAFACTIGAVTCLAEFAARPRRAPLIACFVLAIVAVLSLANGIIAPLLLTFMAWRLRLPRRVVIALGLLALLSLLLIALMPSGGPIVLRVNDPVRLLVYAVRIIGSAPALTLEDFARLCGAAIDPMPTALIAGAIVASAAVTFGMSAILEKTRNAGKVGAAMLAAFALGSALLVALARSFMSIDFALSSRYTIISALMLVALATQVAVWFRPRALFVSIPALLAGALVALMAPLAAVKENESYVQNAHNLLSIQSAIVTGVERQTGLGMLGRNFVPLNQVEPIIAMLRAQRKWMFIDPWSLRVGERVSVAATRRCRDSIGRARRDDNPLGAVLFWRGRIDPAEAQQGHTIVILDRDDVMQGYGLVLRRPYETILSSPHQGIDWRGYARLSSGAEPIIAYLASDRSVVCRIGVYNVTGRSAQPRP